MSKCITTQTAAVVSTTASILDNAAFVDDPSLVALRNLYSLHGQQNVDPVSEQLLGKRKRSYGWREEGQELLENVVRCGSDFWNDLAAADDAHWLKAVLNGISARLTEYECIFLNTRKSVHYFCQIIGKLRSIGSRRTCRCFVEMGHCNRYSVHGSHLSR